MELAHYGAHWRSLALAVTDIGIGHHYRYRYHFRYTKLRIYIYIYIYIFYSVRPFHNLLTSTDIIHSHRNSVLTTFYLDSVTPWCLNMAVFWDVAPYSLVEIDRRFRCAYCLHHQVDEALTM
jgi:hypothetical protein